MSLTKQYHEVANALHDLLNHISKAPLVVSNKRTDEGGYGDELRTFTVLIEQAEVERLRNMLREHAALLGDAT